MSSTSDGQSAAARVIPPGDSPASSSPRGGNGEPVVLRAQRGDLAAFEELYREYVGRVHALCLRLAGDRRRAEELTQDVFVQAWQKLGTFRGESAFASWLHRLAVNVFLVDVRGIRRREARVVGVEEPGALERGGPMRGDAEARIDLERAIATLPPGARTALVLHDIEGYRHDEIARLTGVAVGTVRAQLHRARRLLMQRLDR